MDCEACDFNFRVRYGDFGEGYIECHHKAPLSKYDVHYETTISDLTLVCAYCHRMLHRHLDTLTLEGLKALLG